MNKKRISQFNVNSKMGFNFLHRYLFGRRNRSKWLSHLPIMSVWVINPILSIKLNCKQQKITGPNQEYFSGLAFVPVVCLIWKFLMDCPCFKFTLKFGFLLIRFWKPMCNEPITGSYSRFYVPLYLRIRGS